MSSYIMKLKRKLRFTLLNFGCVCPFHKASMPEKLSEFCLIYVYVA